MANLNKVMLIGNLTRDPELSYLPSNQTPVCELGLAVNRSWTAQDGNKKEEVTWVDCTAFGKAAETLAKYTHKGDPIYLEGRLKLDQWEDKDGGKRSKMRVVVESFQFLGGKRDGNGGGYQGEQEHAPRSAPRETGTRNAARPAPRQAAVKEMLPDPELPVSAGTPLREEDIPF